MVNLLRCAKPGLPKSLAHGFALFLNTTAVDEHFRRFNGHTQVNATDLVGDGGGVMYPSAECGRARL